MDSIKKVIIPGTIPTKDLHQYIIGSIAPRPIAFVSTIDENGMSNLAPYSFFNAFSSNPPILVFSSNRKVTDNKTKDTLHNVIATKECVINVVPFSIVRQMSLASVEFPSDISEFSKVGLTPEASLHISAPRVAESPVNMECKVKDIITLGDEGGAGHLIICEVVTIAVDESVIVDNRLDPNKLDLMGRLGRNYYVRASGDALIEIYQSIAQIPIGYDGLPDYIAKSKILTGNEIATLAALTEMPHIDIINEVKSEFANNLENAELKAKELIADSKPMQALALLQLTNNMK